MLAPEKLCKEKRFMETQLMTMDMTADVVLIPAGADKHARYRLGAFADWLKEQRSRVWHEPDLSAYRDRMLAQGYAPATVRAHLSTVRGRYRELLRDNGLRDALEIAVRERLEAQGQSCGPADVEALVNRKLSRMENAVDPANSPVKTKVSQDVPDSAHLRLTKEQGVAHC